MMLKPKAQYQKYEKYYCIIIYDISDQVLFRVKCCLKGLLKIIKLMLILGQFSLSKG